MTVDLVRFENWPRWFASMWPGAAQRGQVLAQYRAIGQQFPKALADVALRAGVFSADIDVKTELEAGIAIGQRRAALHLFKLCNIDTDELYRQTQDNGREREKS